MHHIAYVAFVGTYAVDYSVVDDEIADQFKVVGHLSSWDEVEHGCFSTSRRSQDGGEGVGWEASGAWFKNFFNTLDIGGFSVDIHLLLDDGVNSDILEGEFHFGHGIKDDVLILIGVAILNFVFGVIVVVLFVTELNFHIYI